MAVTNTCSRWFVPMAVFRTLSAIDELVDAIVELKCISLMSVAMANHVENADLVRETINALGSLVVDGV